MQTVCFSLTHGLNYHNHLLCLVGCFLDKPAGHRIGLFPSTCVQRVHLQVISHSSTSLYSTLSQFINCLYHCYHYRSLQTWLL